MKISLTFSLLFTFVLWSYGQTLDNFSDLNFTNTGIFNSIEADDGIIYFIEELPNNKLVKINWEGEILKELPLPFTDSLYYNGQLLREGDQFYLVGGRRLYPNDQGSNNSEIWNSQRRTVISFDSDLLLSDIYTFDIIPFGAGEIVRTSGTFAGTMYPTTISIKDQQITAVWTYIIFDTQSPNFPIIGQTYQYEKIDLITNEVFVKDLIDVQFLLDGVFLEESFYLYGDVSDTVVNGTSFNSRAVGSFNYEGEKIGLYSFDENFSGGLSDGALASVYKDRIYSTYYGRSVDEEGCIEDNTVIDVRDTLFQLIKRVKLPDCGLFPFGKNNFAFTSNGDFYFSAVDAGDIRLYKFDADLNVICSKVFALAEEIPVSLKITPEDELILETLFADSEMRLYKFNCTGEVSAADPPRDLKPAIAFFPNPSDGLVFTSKETDQFMVDIYTMTGSFLSRVDLGTDEIDLKPFPTGVYLLKVLDKKTGQFITQRRIVKR